MNEFDAIAKIKVIGVGGGGNNTVHSMIKEGIKGVEFIVANTDEQVLNSSIAEKILPLGKDAKGLGAGAKPEAGRHAALESKEAIREALEGADLVMVAAGMGGGTGTGASPVIAKIAKEMGALTIGIVTTPFSFEGTQRGRNSTDGIIELRKHVDSLIVVSNDKLLEQYGGISLKDSFKYADKTLKNTVRTITDLIAVPSLINLDFADVTTVMKNQGDALIGIGRANGPDRAIKAATHAISSPILEATIKGAKNAIINITGGDISLNDANKAVQLVQEAAGTQLNIIFGVSVDESMGSDIQVSVIATGLQDEKKPLSETEIKEEVIKIIETMEMEYENEKTREILLTDPLPEEEKLHISDEFKLQETPFEKEVDNSNDEDGLPDFLK